MEVSETQYACMTVMNVQSWGSVSPEDDALTPAPDGMHTHGILGYCGLLVSLLVHFKQCPPFSGSPRSPNSPKHSSLPPLQDTALAFLVQLVLPHWLWQGTGEG